MLNKVILIGNVGAEPEVRMLDGALKKASLRLATSERYKNAQGETKEATEWHNVELWRNLADVVDKYVRKGDKLYIEGKITTRKYNDREGVERTITTIVANELKMLTAKVEKAQEEVQTATAVDTPPAPSFDGLHFRYDFR